MIDLKENNIIILEGFEMTGKTTLLNKISTDARSRGYNVTDYRPDWESLFSEDIIKRGNRFIHFLVSIDLGRRLMKDNNSVLLLDRGLASSYVYMKLYNQESDCSNPDSLLESLRKLGDSNILFIHKYHKDKTEAEIMYHFSNDDSDHSDSYDKFDDFEDYWNKYLKFEDIFTEFYEKSGFPVIKISSYNSKADLI